MLKIIIFGTGKRYQKLKDSLRNDIDVVAFLDNNPLKWGNMIEGVSIICPEEIAHYTYDLVFLMSTYQKEMREQLIQIGVPGYKIIGDDQIERVCVSDSTKCFGDFPEASAGEKVLIFTHALNSTGAQNVLYLAACMLQKNGYRLAVISKKDGVLRDEFVNMGIPVIVMGNPHTDNNDYIKLINWADKIIVNTVWLYYAAYELTTMEKRVIWWIHETVGFECLNDTLIGYMRNSGFLSTYVVSPLVKRRMRQKLGEDLIIKELAYGLPEYESTVKRTTGQDTCDKLVFAIIGGIGRIKGQDIFIQAVERLGAHYIDKAEFWIVGGGQLEPGDLARVSLYPCIKIVGELKNQDMPDLYHAIDVVVCCSRQEAMSVVVTEGCMNEKLVIVSDAAGNADYIEDGKTGLLFRSEDSGQLAGLMEWVIDHKEKAEEIGRSGKAIYEKYFKMELFEENLLQAIGHITEREENNGKNINTGTGL